MTINLTDKEQTLLTSITEGMDQPGYQGRLIWRIVRRQTANPPTPPSN